MAHNHRTIPPRIAEHRLLLLRLRVQTCQRSPHGLVFLQITARSHRHRLGIWLLIRPTIRIRRLALWVVLASRMPPAEPPLLHAQSCRLLVQSFLSRRAVSPAHRICITGRLQVCSSSTLNSRRHILRNHAIHRERQHQATIVCRGPTLHPIILQHLDIILCNHTKPVRHLTRMHHQVTCIPGSLTVVATCCLLSR